MLRKENNDEIFDNLYKELVTKRDYNRYLKDISFEELPSKEELIKISDYYYDIFRDEFI